MKKRFGKVTAYSVMAFAIVFLFAYAVIIPAVYGRPTVSDATNKLGGFSGDGGAAQDDSTKASLDLAHTDLDAIIRDLGIQRSTNGSIFYVDAGVAGATGVSWATAVADIEAATVLCTTSAGDIIVVAPGHVEAMTAADDIDLDKIGITVIGLGTGNHRPTFSYTANGELVFGADNCAIYNLRFIATADSVLQAIDVENGVDGFTIAHCEFSAETTTADEFDDVIIVNTTTTNGIIRNNRFLGDIGSNADPQSCIVYQTSNYLQITDNEFYGDRAVACVENATAANFTIIKDNIMYNGIIGGTAGLNTIACISLHASTSALITDNTLFCNVADQSLSIVAADGFLAGNTYGEGEGTDAGSYPISRAPGGRTNVTVATTSAMTAGNGYGAADDPPIFTVTGDILCRAACTFATQITSTSNDTLELGVVGTTAILLVQDVADATAFDAGDTWTLETAADDDGGVMDDSWVVVSGGNIILTINDHDLTAGVASFYLEWIGLSANANVADVAP